LCVFVFFCFSFLVNPIASSHFPNAPQQNLTQNYSLHPNNANNNVNAQAMQMSNHYDASSFNSNSNFNNFDPSNQFQSYQSATTQYQQQQNSAQNFEVGQMHQSQQIYQQQQQTQQFYGQSSSSMIAVSHQQHQGLNGPSSTYQHTISDLLVQNSTPTYQQPQPQQQQSLYNNQVQSNQSVRIFLFN
jgi:hypothetical protein